MMKTCRLVIQVKKIVSAFLVIAGCISLLAVSASPAEAAAEQPSRVIKETVSYFEDGSSVVITVSETLRSAVPYAGEYKVSGAKEFACRDNSGKILWKFTLHGTFLVNPGVSAVCTETSYAASDLASGWSLKSGSSYASGNQAIGDGTFQHKTLFIVTDTKSCHVVLTCDNNGNLS